MVSRYTIGSSNLYILGFSSNEDPKIIFNKLKDILGDNFTLLNKNCVFTSKQILIAFILAKRAHERKKNISKSIGMEILLHIAGTRQIKDALKKCGYSGGDGIIVAWDIPKDSIKKISEIVKITDLNLSAPSLEALKNYLEYDEKILENAIKSGTWEMLVLEKLQEVELEK